MIEKLELPSSARLVCGKDYDLAFKYIKQTVNQLVDAVNELQESQNTYWTDIAEIKKELQTPAENMQDKFAEQRKWIGKLCKFWTFRRENAIIGLLTDFEIDEPHFRMDGLGWYEHCEPVKPDDDIIYRGE